MTLTQQILTEIMCNYDEMINRALREFSNFGCFADERIHVMNNPYEATSNVNRNSLCLTLDDTTYSSSDSYMVVLHVHDTQTWDITQ